MASKGKEIICVKCGRIGKLCARGLCNSCYDADIKSRKMRICPQCGELKPHHADGFCTHCYKQKHDKKVWQSILDYLKADRKKRPDVHKAREEKREPQRKVWRQEYNQKTYPEKRSRLLQYQKEYKANNPDKVTHWGHARRSRIRGLPHDLTIDEWNETVESHNHCCHYCGEPSDNLQREHKIPVSRGGGFTKDNIVPACPTCNYRKNKMTESEFFEFLKKYPR